jgi:hypothetical protein
MLVQDEKKDVCVTMLLCWIFSICHILFIIYDVGVNCILTEVDIFMYVIYALIYTKNCS